MTDWNVRLLAGGPLTAAESEAAFDRFMDDSATQVEMAALLTVLRIRGPTPHEIAVEVDADDAIDTCGTGGGALTTFNISTAASFVAVAGGARVAKHGNRSFTSLCGSADVLEALGIALEPGAARMHEMFEKTGFVFMYAPAHHPAMRHVGPVRRELGVTTVMNILGPLANPARVRRQVVGVADPALLGLVAEALLELGHLRALVVHGEPGLDELSPLGPTRAVSLADGELQEIEIVPEDYGLGGGTAADLGGAEPAEIWRARPETIGAPGERPACATPRRRSG